MRNHRRTWKFSPTHFTAKMRNSGKENYVKLRKFLIYLKITNKRKGPDSRYDFNSPGLKVNVSHDQIHYEYGTGQTEGFFFFFFFFEIWSLQCTYDPIPYGPGPLGPYSPGPFMI